MMMCLIRPISPTLFSCLRMESEALAQLDRLDSLVKTTEIVKNVRKMSQPPISCRVLLLFISNLILPKNPSSMLQCLDSKCFCKLQQSICFSLLYLSALCKMIGQISCCLYLYSQSHKSFCMCFQVTEAEH